MARERQARAGLSTTRRRQRRKRRRKSGMSTDDDSTTEATFTRAQMAKMVNAQVKEKLAAALAEYGDLDELKAKAAEADTNRGKIDQVLDKLNAAEKRAADAELENTRRKVADKLGLTARE